MTDNVTQQKRAKIMRAVKSSDSKIEVKFRKFLWNKGFRYRKNCSNYHGKPDLVLKSYKTVIFVDSCFWHGCKLHYRKPASNSEYWSKKYKRNIERDLNVNGYYRKQSWNVFRVWEHDLKNDEQIKKIIGKIKNKLDSYKR